MHWPSLLLIAAVGVLAQSTTLEVIPWPTRTTAPPFTHHTTSSINFFPSTTTRNTTLGSDSTIVTLYGIPQSTYTYSASVMGADQSSTTLMLTCSRGPAQESSTMNILGGASRVDDLECPQAPLVVTYGAGASALHMATTTTAADGGGARYTAVAEVSCAPTAHTYSDRDYPGTTLVATPIACVVSASVAGDATAYTFHDVDLLPAFPTYYSATVTVTAGKDKIVAASTVPHTPDSAAAAAGLVVGPGAGNGAVVCLLSLAGVIVGFAILL